MLSPRRGYYDKRVVRRPLENLELLARDAPQQQTPCLCRGAVRRYQLPHWLVCKCNLPINGGNGLFTNIAGAVCYMQLELKASPDNHTNDFVYQQDQH